MCLVLFHEVIYAVNAFLSGRERKLSGSGLRQLGAQRLNSKVIGQRVLQPGHDAEIALSEALVSNYTVYFL